MPDYTDRDKPGLGALSDIFKSAANMYTHILPEYRQKYAEFQEEKRKAAQGQSNWESQQGATADYRGSMLDIDRGRLAEMIRSNKVGETPKPTEEKPLTESQVKAGLLAGMPPGKQEQYMFGSGKESKPDASIVRALLDLWKSQRYVPEEQGVDANEKPFLKEGYYPPVAGVAGDTANYITQTGQWPSQPLGGISEMHTQHNQYLADKASGGNQVKSRIPFLQPGVLGGAPQQGGTQRTAPQSMVAPEVDTWGLENYSEVDWQKLDDTTKTALYYKYK